MPLPDRREGKLLGIDVSGPSQGRIDAAVLVEHGVDFLYAKATDGEHSVDKQWAATAFACGDAGLPFGAYGVLEPYGVARAEAQARHFIELVSGSGATLAPWCDFELARGLTGLQALKSADIWCDIVEQALGQRVMIYTMPSFVSDLERFAGHAGDEVVARLGERMLVIAHYTQDYDHAPSIPAPWTRAAIWQASGGRPRPGHPGSRNYATLPWADIDVDIDWFDGTLDDLLALGDPPPNPRQTA